MFISTFEKQLDAKRRIVVPAELRAAVAPLDGVFCFPSIEADCLEGGGQQLVDAYQSLIEEFPFGDPARTALQSQVLGQMVRLSFDAAGRMTLPESYCQAFDLTDWVSIMGLGDRFQIWPREALSERMKGQRDVAREALTARSRLRLARLAQANG